MPPYLLIPILGIPFPVYDFIIIRLTSIISFTSIRLFLPYCHMYYFLIYVTTLIQQLSEIPVNMKQQNLICSLPI